MSILQRLLQMRAYSTHLNSFQSRRCHTILSGNMGDRKCKVTCGISSARVCWLAHDVPLCASCFLTVLTFLVRAFSPKTFSMSFSIDFSPFGRSGQLRQFCVSGADFWCVSFCDGLWV